MVEICSRRGVGARRARPGSGSIARLSGKILAVGGVLLLSASLAAAQAGPAAQAGAPGGAAQKLARQLRGLNNRLLLLHAQAQQLTPGEAGAVRREAAQVIAQRAAALRALIRQDPRAALTFAFSTDLLARLAARFPASASRLESDGTWEGPIEVWVADDAARARAVTFYRMRLAGRLLELHFAGSRPARLKSGDRLQVTGVLVDSSLVASASTLTSPSSPSAETTAPSGGACSTTGAQNAAVLLVTFPGIAPPMTPQAVYDVFFGATGRSLDDFWRETSAGQTSATGNVFGWYTLTGSYSCLAMGQLLSDALAAASGSGVDVQSYDRLFVVYPGLSPSCGVAGLSSIGCTTVSYPAGSFTASTSYLLSSFLTQPDQAIELVTHEAGHQLGLNHASSRDFTPDVLGPLGAAGTLDEYGDHFSTMGYWNLGEYNAPHKAEELGWLANGSTYQVVQTSGTYTLAPLESAAGGLQALKVQRGAGNDAWVWVEYRQPIGNYDPTLPSQAFSGALIHYEDSTTGIHTHLLDFTPSTASWDDPALAAGDTWADPYTNLSITVESATSSDLTVSVNYGPDTCAQAAPTVAVSPANPSVSAGSSASYTVTVTNNDSTACASSAFDLSSAQPSGWLAGFSAAQLALSPGQSASATLTETPPAGTAPGTYAVSAAAADGSLAASSSVNCTVASLPALAVSVSVPSSSYSVRSTVPIAATVLSGSSPAAGASVAFTLTRADGTTATGTATADSTGTAAWSYTISRKDPTGTYSVTASATYNSVSATSSPAIFTVTGSGGGGGSGGHGGRKTK
jgi:M6 family metalloprotease-like protein